MHKFPFLEYFLFKEKKEKGDTLHFPRFEYESSVNVLTKSMTIIQLLGMSYYKNADYDFKGYLFDDNNLYLFFDCSGLQLDGFKMSRNNDLWMVTVDEIINQNKICNFQIEESVTDFFINNNELLYLTDSHGCFFEIPTVLYAGCLRKEYEFKTNFGISTSGVGSLMGNYYYFTDYQNAFKMSGWINENNKGGGLLRCALFLGKMKVPINNPDDNIDESLLTQNIILNMDNSEEQQKAKLLLKISDRDGLWAKDYDSVYLGKIELDDGSLFEDYPLWVIKNYEQQVVLSSHIVDVKSLDDKWSRENEYSTL
jgi:hypothetical protein